MSDANTACRAIARVLPAHLDGELDAVKTLEVEDHLTACELCRERLAVDRATRDAVKRAVRAEAPADLRARMLAAMSAEAVREGARDEGAAEDDDDAIEAEISGAFNQPDESPPRGVLRHWRTALPLASAAALALAWGMASNQPNQRGSADMMSAGFGNDDLLRELVAEHSRPLPPERTKPEEVRALEKYVGVPVRVPHFDQRRARFVGGRVLGVQGERAAMLQYEFDQGGSVQRVSVFIYDPQRVRVNGPTLAPRAVGTAEVRVGRAQGYSIAVTQHRGVGYTVASDLDTDSSAQLVAAADQ